MSLKQKVVESVIDESLDEDFESLIIAKEDVDGRKYVEPSSAMTTISKLSESEVKQRLLYNEILFEPK